MDNPATVTRHIVPKGVGDDAHRRAVSDAAAELAALRNVLQWGLLTHRNDELIQAVVMLDMHFAVLRQAMQSSADYLSETMIDEAMSWLLTCLDDAVNEPGATEAWFKQPLWEADEEPGADMYTFLTAMDEWWAAAEVGDALAAVVGLARGKLAEDPRTLVRPSGPEPGGVADHV